MRFRKAITGKAHNLLPDIFDKVLRIMTLVHALVKARLKLVELAVSPPVGDGAPEFLDGWGKPISFLRWPAGFVSELQPLDISTGNRNPDKDHDPFDPLRVHKEAYRLVPLIYSAGPDGVFDIRPAQDFVMGLNPYVDTDSGAGNQFIGDQRDGGGDGENWHDNIHNHLLDVK